MKDSDSIRAEGLFRGFGPSAAITDLSFGLDRGGRLAVLGPNGAGKSTLLKIVAGALAPHAGTIRVFGKSPSERRLEPGFLGWLPERAPLNQELTVLEHLRMAARLRGLNPKRTGSETDRLTEALALGPWLRRLAGRLSQGGRRQAALAVALMGDPELVILDEPSSSLDPEGVRRLKALLAALPKGTTLMVSGHILSELMPLTDSALIIEDGRQRAQGTWEGLARTLGVRSAPDSLSYPEDIYFGAMARK
ncbi:MAG: ABC transporter ATP-binding protein [Deltaproteobacteria bacterium]|jgi:ABC-2 type transport system ATP-binding protein|nr:ABC transporter ATP-binding protein [Deltaproteobacteria bacterium]